MADTKDLRGIKEGLPTHEQIEKRAYEIYQKKGGDGHAEEHWLTAEQELRREQAKGHDPMPFNSNPVIAGAVRRAK
jgi:hypothetical protein